MDKQFHRGDSIAISIDSPDHPGRRGRFLYISPENVEYAICESQSGFEIFAAPARFLCFF